MRIFYLIFIGFFSLSCATNSVATQNIKEGEIVNNKVPEHNIQIIIRQHIPYCGGAYPSNDQRNRSNPYDAGLVLFNATDGSKRDVNAKNGILYLN